MNDETNVLRRKGWKTYTLGGVLAFLGSLFAFIQGVDWNVIFSAEGAAVAGAGIALGRALVALFSKIERDNA
jgi:hypothetical protein